jgi:ATP-dependent Lon protease
LCTLLTASFHISGGPNYQEVLGTLNIKERLKKTLAILKGELHLAKIQARLAKQLEEKMSKNQRR